MQKSICLSFLLLVALFLAVCSITANAQARKPDWVESFDPYQKYPASEYLAGFGTSAGKDSEAVRIAEDNARADVSRIIVVDIQSLLRTLKEEVNQKFSQHLSSITQSSTAIQLMGLDTETYRDNDPPTIYALAYVNKADLKRIYSRKESDLRSQIRKIIADAQAAEHSSRNMEAATKYLSLYPLYEELKEAETILLVVDRSTRIEDAFAELDREVGEISLYGSSEEPLMSWTEVSSKIDELLSQSLGTVDDVASSLVIQLSKQIGDLSEKLMVVPFTYQDTKMTSSFAGYLRSALENRIGQTAKLKWDDLSQKRDFRPKSAQITRDLAKASGAQWMLSGTYWEQDGKIKLMATLRDVDAGKILAGANVLFDADILRSAGLSLKPENYQKILSEENGLAEGEIISGQLQVDVWTNKGDQNLLFTEGEIMKVYVRVNRPAYIRLLYTLASGKRTLLYDSYYIDQSKVNHTVEIPQEFECAPPFGAEMLFAIAGTEEFEPLETVEIDGYDYLKEDVPTDQARGMKRKEDKKVHQTEKRIIITTMKE